MKILYFTLALLIVFAGACMTPTVPTPDDLAINSVESYVTDYLGDNPIDILERDFKVDWSVRTAQWNVPIYMQRDWVALAVAEAWADMWGNPLFDKQFMLCYLYNYAIFKSSDGNWYFGTKGWFAGGENEAFPDEQVYAIVVALEQHGEEPYWPVIEPNC